MRKEMNWGGGQEGRKWLECKKIKSNFKKGKENKN